MTINEKDKIKVLKIFSKQYFKYIGLYLYHFLLWLKLWLMHSLLNLKEKTVYLELAFSGKILIVISKDLSSIRGQTLGILSAIKKWIY